MKIVIDARMLYATGIGRYTKHLLDEYESSQTEHEFIVLMRPQDIALWQPSRANFTPMMAPYNPYTLGEQISLLRLIRSVRPDVVHFPSFNTPLLYFLLKISPSVVTVHDLTLLDHRTSRYEGLKRVLQGYKQIPFMATLQTAILRSTAVITDTKYVREQIVDRYQANPERVTAIALGAESTGHSLAPIDRFGIVENFLLYVGNFYPYKNIAALVAALAKVPSAHQLVLCGNEDYFINELRVLVSELGLQERVIFAGYVTDGELAALYKQATLYTFPSLSEGFGLPGLEAMAHGTPVIAARATCLPEVYGDAAAYFENPNDSASMAKDLIKLLGDETRLKKLSEAGPKHVKKFSWEETAKKTLAIYEKVAR